ncbi:type II toxin-antitoxin system Phd/YefM family antitoxin [Moorellaceae bacterium AZ2]
MHVRPIALKICLLLKNWDGSFGLIKRIINIMIGMMTVRMVNVTEIRTSIWEVLSELAKTREPIVVLQRSKPVAYLVDPETFEKLWHADEHVSLKERRREIYDRVLRLRSKMAGKATRPEDSVLLLRRLREGQGRNE